MWFDHIILAVLNLPDYFVQKEKERKTKTNAMFFCKQTNCVLFCLKCVSSSLEKTNYVKNEEEEKISPVWHMALPPSFLLKTVSCSFFCQRQNECIVGNENLLFLSTLT